MARIRSIHPGLFTDERFVSLGADAQIFLLGLWTEADDQGLFEWKPITLRMRLRPTKDGSVDSLLDELVAAHTIKKFEIAGRCYGAIRNFRKFQRPKKPNAIHPMTDEIRNYVALTTSNSPPEDSDVDEVTPDETVGGEKSLLVKEGGGRMNEGASDSPSEPAPPSVFVEGPENPEFIAFFFAFPKQEGGKDASKFYFAARRDKGVSRETLLDGAKRYTAHLAVTEQKLRYAKKAETWLAGECWNDRYDTEPKAPAPDVVIDPSWGDRAQKLSAAVEPKFFDAYFAAAEFVDSDPPRIRFKSRSAKDLAERKCGRALKSTFGEIMLEVRA